MCLGIAGCAATPTVPEPAVAVDTLPVQRGDDGSPATWTEMIDAIADADVVILGEQHDDATGHRVQLAVVEQMLQRWPGTAVSMEMLDRSEQAIVDDYLAGYIDRDQFLERTAATHWRRISQQYLDGEINRSTFETRITGLGWIDWEGFYQPVIDAAKDAGAPVVAANTPWALYTSVARREGFEGLATVTPAQATLFEVPSELPTGRYRERFWETLAGRAEGEPPDDTGDDAGDDAPAAHGHDLSDEAILGMFRGQAIMDATMAASIAAALDAGAPKAVHLVGHFHCDYEGGLVQELRRLAPDARILVISMPGDDADDDDDADDEYGRADFLVDTRMGSDPI